MFPRNLHLPPDLHDFVRVRVESGRYENANELVRAALRALHREESNSEIQSSASGIAEGDVFRRLWETSVQPSRTLR